MWTVQPSSDNFSSMSASALASALRRIGLGGVLGEDAVALKNESLSFPRAFGLASVGDCFVLPGWGGLQ